MSSTAIMCFSDAQGGMEHDAIKLAKLLGSNRDVVLVCKQQSFIHQSVRESVKDYSCKTINFSSRILSPSMFFGVRKIIRKLDIKNVIFFGASELKTLHFAFLGFDLNLIVRHGTTKSRPKTDWLHRLVYSNVNYHVALSKHLLRNVRQIVPETPGVDYRLIYSSFEFAKTAEVQRPESEALVITHVGRIAAGKGQIDAVIACKELAASGVDFSLELLGGVEDVKIENALQSEIDRLGLSGYVKLRGHVNNVSEVLSYTDIFLFPSAGEGMPNAFIEALHYGIPCLAYSNTVFPEFLEMGFYVTLASDSDAEDLAEKLTAIAKNIDKEKQASNINIKLATKYFNNNRELEAWQEILA